jgi:hypothetical protein
VGDHPLLGRHSWELLQADRVLGPSHHIDVSADQDAAHASAGDQCNVVGSLHDAPDLGSLDDDLVFGSLGDVDQRNGFGSSNDDDDWAWSAWDDLDV